MKIQQMITRFSFYLLAWCTLAVGPVRAQTITHIPLFTFHGDSVGSVTGFSVSDAGDVNGDGVPDLTVSVTTGFSEGRVRLFSGSDGSVLHTFDNDLGRQSVSNAGDVNGDGFSDFIIGTDQDFFDRGSVQVFSGATGSVLYNFRGDSLDDHFGGSVSGAGDVNGDGVDDLIVGAAGDDPNGSRSGSARVFSGVDGSILYNFLGESDFDNFGSSVSRAGDVNRDGFDDLIVAADPTFSSNAGRVLSGTDGAVLFNFDGSPARGAGDVDGDGVADLIVGGLTVRVLSGVDGGLLYDLGAGVGFSGAGDVNADGFADLVVGASGDSGNGINTGQANVFSGVDGSVLHTLYGDSANDHFGRSVSGVGDINGDGMADFIVGASGGGTNNDGYARVFVSQITNLGDVDQDGVVNFSDIPPFISTLTSGSFLAQADCNQDGIVNFSDIPAFIEILTAQ